VAASAREASHCLAQPSPGKCAISLHGATAGTITRRGIHTASVADSPQRQQLDSTRTIKAAGDDFQALRSGLARNSMQNFASQRPGRYRLTARDAGGKRRWRPTAPATRPHPRERCCYLATTLPPAQRGSQATSKCKISLHSATVGTGSWRGMQAASVDGRPRRQQLDRTRASLLSSDASRARLIGQPQSECKISLHSATASAATWLTMHTASVAGFPV